MLDQLLMQVVTTNGSDVIGVASPALLDQVSATANSLSALISVIVGAIVYGIVKFRQVTKKDLSERDKMTIEALKSGQMAVQKTAEVIGQNKKVMQALYEADVPEEYRKQLEAKMTPILQDADQMLKKANEQAAMIKGRATQYFGDTADVDQDPTIPRESKEISQRFRTA